MSELLNYRGIQMNLLIGGWLSINVGSKRNLFVASTRGKGSLTDLKFDRIRAN